jgi:hypothetical protein
MHDSILLLEMTSAAPASWPQHDTTSPAAPSTSDSDNGPRQPALRLITTWRALHERLMLQKLLGQLHLPNLSAPCHLAREFDCAASGTLLVQHQFNPSCFAAVRRSVC